MLDSYKALYDLFDELVSVHLAISFLTLTRLQTDINTSCSGYGR